MPSKKTTKSASSKKSTFNKTKTKIKSTDIASSVMSKIKSDQVKMKPKSYFILGSVLLGVGFTFAIIIALMFFAIGTFHLRTTDPIGFLKYGRLGAPIFSRIFPWKPLLITIVSIVSGLWMLKKYDISYKKSFLTLSIVFVTTIVSLGFILDKVGINDRLRNQAPLKPLYKQRFIQDDFVMGEIISASDSSILITDPRSKESVQVVWDDKTMLPVGSEFQVGDHIGAIGVFKDDIFLAKGLHIGGMMWHPDHPSMATESGYPQRQRIPRRHMMGN